MKYLGFGTEFANISTHLNVVKPALAI